MLRLPYLEYYLNKNRMLCSRILLAVFNFKTQHTNATPRARRGHPFRRDSSSLVPTSLGQCTAWQTCGNSRGCLAPTRSVPAISTGSGSGLVHTAHGPQSSAWTLDRTYIGGLMFSLLICQAWEYETNNGSVSRHTHLILLVSDTSLI
jgi:hypothetical protein